MRKIVRTAVAASGAGLALLVPSAAAHAATYSINTIGVRLSYTIAFTSPTSVDPANLRLFDISCDDRAAATYITVYPVGGRPWDTAKRYNAGGCGTDRSWSSTIRDGRGVVGIRVFVCRDDGLCAGRYHDNGRLG